MASFGRPGSSSDGDIVEPLTLSSAQIQMLREEYMRLYGRKGASSNVHNQVTANPGADIHGGSNPETIVNPPENARGKEAAETTARATPEK